MPDNGLEITVRGLDVSDGAPIVDIKAGRQSKAPGEVTAAWGRVHDTMVRDVLLVGAGTSIAA